MAENAPNGEVQQPNLPNFLGSVRLKYVKLGYHYLISNAIYVLIVPILAAVVLHLSTLTVEDLMNHFAVLKSCSTLVVFLGTVYFMSRPRNVYLVDFACYKPHERFMISKQRMIEKMPDIFDEESVMFQKKILERSGLGDKTYFYNDDSSSIPFKFNFSSNQFQDGFRAFLHTCGGRAVLDELQKNLELPELLMESSRMTLYRFGNTSSSSLWYNLAYSEAKCRIKKGDRVWQIGFGSGFKCNSAVWRALRTVDAAKEKNAWTDDIQDFPVHLPC